MIRSFVEEECACGRMWRGNQVDIGDGAKVGPLYLRKTTLNGAPIPMDLIVTITGD